MEDVRIIQGDCLDVLPTLEADSVDCVITDPPYPEIDRDYGRMTEAAWHKMMRVVVAEVRRILRPSGSAVFILQPNSERVGRMRPWLFEFQAWTCREWNMVQDAWWWNTAAIPEHHAIQGRLMRPSIKACVWLGEPDCYRDQGEILWSPTMQSAARMQSARAGRDENPSGHGVSSSRVAKTVKENGGVTPYNLIPIPNTNHVDNGGRYGHPAATPMALCDYWVRYICPIGGTVLDCFMGSGTVLLSALSLKRKAIGIESNERYFRVAEQRIERPHAPVIRQETEPIGPLFAGLEDVE